VPPVEEELEHLRSPWFFFFFFPFWGGARRATSKRHKHHCNGVINHFWVLIQMFAGFANEIENGVKIIMLK
jgi:hypothetical protein